MLYVNWLILVYFFNFLGMSIDWLCVSIDWCWKYFEKSEKLFHHSLHHFIITFHGKSLHLFMINYLISILTIVMLWFKGCIHTINNPYIFITKFTSFKSICKISIHSFSSISHIKILLKNNFHIIFLQKYSWALRDYFVSKFHIEREEDYNQLIKVLSNTIIHIFIQLLCKILSTKDCLVLGVLLMIQDCWI